MFDVNLTFSRPGFSLSAAFTLHAGGITVLRGDSGSGKTTLADLLSGATVPQKGRIVSDNDVWFDSDSHINLPTQSRGSALSFKATASFRISPLKKTSAFRFCSASESRFSPSTSS